MQQFYRRLRRKIKANVKKLFEKAPKAAKGKVGKPVEQAAEDAGEAEGRWRFERKNTGSSCAKPRVSPKMNIDITVDDD